MVNMQGGILNHLLMA